MDHVLIYSGGMDSYTLLHYINSKRKMRLLGVPEELRVLSFDYGQRHKKELECAIAECAKLGLHHQVIDLSQYSALLQGSALVKGPEANIDVPDGHYEAESMRLTVVPGRNTLMLSFAMAYAESLTLLHEKKYGRPGSATVYFGAHAGDHHIYPDCRESYVECFDSMARLATEAKVSIWAPFIDKTKGDILGIGKTLGLDYANTWTCYKGGERPCGKCGSCNERAEAFAENNMVDPTL
jgi:7-cyano-7-deazaguanine synthase